MADSLVSIIIPQYNHWDLTHRCLWDLYNFCAQEQMEIIVIDDGSTDPDCMSGIGWWQRNGLFASKIRFKHLEENQGFGGANNRGAGYAKGDVLIFLSNDVLVHGNFIRQIRDKLNSDPNTLIGGRVIDWPGGWNEVSVDGKQAVIPYAEGWLLACTRAVWDQLGGFDPIYGKFDVEDLDLSTTAHSLGIRVTALNSPFLKHISGQTISKLKTDRLAHTKENQRRYHQKWQNRFSTIFDKWEKAKV